MPTALQERPSTVHVRPDVVTSAVGERFLDRLEARPRGGDPEVIRQRQASWLTSRTGMRRGPLRQLRAHYQQRLQRRTDDFEAAEGLQVVEGALASLPRPEGVFAWQDRERRRQRRRWRRRHG